MSREANLTWLRERGFKVAAGDPPETAATLERLVAGGASRHAALHAVMSVVATQL